MFCLPVVKPEPFVVPVLDPIVDPFVVVPSVGLPSVFPVVVVDPFVVEPLVDPVIPVVPPVVTLAVVVVELFEVVGEAEVETKAGMTISNHVGHPLLSVIA
jgi:hypothetical protein